MGELKKDIKEGITLHIIPTKNFKTNLLAVFLTVPLERKNVTLDTLLTLVLRRGSKSMPTQEEISKKLEEMYGASFDCGIEKTGDNHVLKFYLESLNDEYLPQKQDLLKESINTLFSIIWDPLTENGTFKRDYVEAEKQNLKQIIEGKIDNKAVYALERCIEEMYQDKPYGLYKYGYIEDLEKINEKNLYDYYQTFMEHTKIDIFLSGNIDESAEKEIKNSEEIQKLKERKAKFVVNNEETEKKEKVEVKEVEEKMDIAQGKLVMGLAIHDNTPESRYPALVYNAILGGTANSKLFQNVREKASLAYTASSAYVRQKNNVFIRCGIEVENYKKAIDIINKQLEDMKSGNFSEEDMKNAKNFIEEMIEGITDEQDTEISYYLGQELSGHTMNFNQYKEAVDKVKKEDVVNLANQITTEMIYFLRN